MRSSFRRSGAAGTTLLELIVVVAIVGVLLAISVPSVQSSLKSVHLSSATSSVTGAIQSTRYKAIVTGCNYQVIFSQSTTTYQVTWLALGGIPPVCAATYTNALPGGTLTIPWSTSGDVSLKASTTLQFIPSGIVSLVSGGSTPCTGNGTTPVACLVLSNGTTATNTIIVSGVGNVTVTSP
jgi:Tfp pilus assembly protein FimT